MADISTQLEESSIQLTMNELDHLSLNDSQDVSANEVSELGELGQFDHLDQHDDDDQNEFLHSSTFLSNTEIMRTSNLNNTKPKEYFQDSPTEKKPARHKNHFQLFVKKEFEKQALTSDNDGDDGDDDDIEEETKVDTIHRHNGIPRSESQKLSLTTRFIDIDNPSATPKLPKMKPETTPWRKLRPQSTYLNRTDYGPSPQSAQLPDPMSMNFIESILDGKVNDESASPVRSYYENGTSAGSDGTSSTTAHNTHEIENLRTQVTNYKLQLRLLSELIRSIIKSSGNGDDIKNEIMARLERENDSLLNERSLLRRELKSKGSSPATPEFDEAKYNAKVKEVLALKDDLASTRNLNNELGSYIEELKSQLNSNDDMINNINNSKDNWEQLANDVLTLLLDALEGDSATGIIQARDKSNSIDTKLKVISLAVNEFLENFDSLTKELHAHSSRALSFNNENQIPDDLKEKIQEKLRASKSIEDDLKSLVVEQSSSLRVIKSEYESLKLQFNENVQFVAKLKKLLATKSAKVTELSDKILDLEAQLEEMIEIQQSNGKEKETQLLKNRLNLVKLNHSKEIQRHEQEIEGLKRALEEQKNQNEDKKLTEELLRKQREISELNNEIGTLNHQLSLRSKDDSTVDNLKSLLKNSRSDFDVLQREYNGLQQALKESEEELQSNEKEYKTKLEHALKELNLAVAKQRTLLAEKSKLTFALEDMKREKSNLALSNSTLTEKVGRLGYQVSLLSSYELGFKSLYQLQVQFLESLLHCFGNVLDGSSVVQADQKFKKLFDSDMEFDQIHSILRSLFAYFENAISSLIEDHSELLIKMNQGVSENEELKDEIDVLGAHLEWCKGTFKNTENESDKSTAMLRINELEKKRKAEREKRKQEHEAFTSKIKALEKENKDLRDRLKN